jgi:hypothetical protein
MGLEHRLVEAAVPAAVPAAKGWQIPGLYRPFR